MFESNDWDFGEDYLTNIEDFNTSFDDGDRVDLKKRKIDDEEPVLTSSQKKVNSSVLVTQVNACIEDNKVSKKKKAVDLFNQTINSTRNEICTQSQFSSQSNKETNKTNKESSQTSQSERRQKVADLFKKDQQSSSSQKSETTSSNISKSKKSNPISSFSNIFSQSQKTQSETYSKKDSEKEVSEPAASGESARYNPKPGSSKNSSIWLTPDDGEKDNSVNISSSTPKSQQRPEISKSNERRQLVLDCFKKSSEIVLPKRTVVRKFPGPAGLLPDDSNDSFGAIDLGDFDSINEDSLNNFDASGICSQRTTNLYTEGAWRLMLQDLPANFLKGYDISTIKQKAKLKKFKNNRIPFMAGIVESIDYGSNNPKLVLKDFSGDIECCLHCKITKAHPNVLDYGVVILLKDVRIIASKTYLYAMAPLNSLISMYSQKERIVTTPNLELLKTVGSMDDFSDSFEGNFNMQNEDVNAADKPKDNTTKKNNQGSSFFETSGKDDPFNLTDDFFSNEVEFSKKNRNDGVSNSRKIGDSDVKTNEISKTKPDTVEKSNQVASLFETSGKDAFNLTDDFFSSEVEFSKETKNGVSNSRKIADSNPKSNVNNNQNGRTKPDTVEKSHQGSSLFETSGKEDAFNLTDDFFNDEFDFNKENKSEKMGTNEKGKTAVPKVGHIESDSADKCKNKKTESQSINFFDMDDEEFFAVDEHISQVDQSLFSPPSKKSKKMDHFICKNSNKEKADVSNSERSTAVQSKAGKASKEDSESKIAALKKFAFQKKAPSVLSKSIATNNTNSTTSSDDRIEKKQMKAGDLCKPSRATNVSSTKNKLLQIQRQEEDPPTQGSASASSNMFDNLFTCEEDDILMSQIEIKDETPKKVPKSKTIPKPATSTNVGSAKMKLLQFKRQEDEPEKENVPESTSHVKASTQFSDFNDDLFSCEDDILMSQIELDSFHT